MRTALLIVRRTVKWFALTLVVLTVLLVAGWRLIPDETLDLNAQLLMEHTTAIPAGQNSYYALWGFKAAPTLEPHSVGQQIVSGFAAAIASKDGSAARFRLEQYWGEGRLRSPDRKRYCRRGAPNCLAVYRGVSEEVAVESREFAVYLERYRGLRAYPQFAETMRSSIDMPFIPWADLLHASELVDAQIAIDAGSEAKRANALRELAAEIVLWRDIGTAADTLITKMMSMAQLLRKYRLASELLAAYPELVEQQREVMAIITSPLESRSTSMRRVLDGEFRFTASYFLDMNSTWNKETSEVSSLQDFASLFAFAGPYKPHATLNLQFHKLRAVGDFYSQPARTTLEQDAQFQQKTNDFEAYAPSTIAYNPVGKVLVNVAAPWFGEYAYRLHDLAGFTRLLELQRRIVLARVPRQEVERYLATVDSSLFDPYTEKPMKWNASTGEIWFKPHSQNFAEERGASIKIPR